MQLRVNTALAQFIKPIATSQTQGPAKQETTGQRPRDQTHSQGNFQRFQSSQEQNPKIIPFPDPDEKKKEEPKVTAQPGSPGEKTDEKKNTGTTFSFLRLFTDLQQHRGRILRWLGHRAYAGTLSHQKQSGKLRKGAMLDLKK